MGDMPEKLGVEVRYQFPRIRIRVRARVGSRVGSSVRVRIRVTGGSFDHRPRFFDGLEAVILKLSPMNKARVPMNEGNMNHEG